ncbi:hypothetical protein [Hoeflea sp. EC-HK425]|uniref:hypothetical protein n=1 Tax=Hoeflea sp. EC-HK425 TaxID=2038388 RepID=UPI00125C2CE6|nr:hypothetical protein [Hoeflea sp. EC-HK425]VVT28540.1 conserved hypothetical protein [Hoeflea sp. EC-HK425]
MALPASFDDALWSMLGRLAESRSPASIPVLTGLEHLSRAPDDLSQPWRKFNAGGDRIDLVAICSPHALLAETRRFADRLDAQHCHNGTRAIVTIARKTLADMAAQGIIDRLPWLTVLPAWFNQRTAVSFKSVSA